MRVLQALIFSLLISVLSAEDFRPNMGPDLEWIEVTCGDVCLMLRQQSQWTPGRFDFRGSPMTTEKSAYGTVFLFPEVGFIGTAHLENEPENLTKVDLYLDGEKISTPQSEMIGETFRFDRESIIRDFRLSNTIEIVDNRIYETSTIEAKKETPLKLVYHFMHAWRSTVSAFLAKTGDGEVSGGFTIEKKEDRMFHINSDIEWVAIYEPESGQFAVSKILASPKEVKQSSKLWEVPGTYRKYYLAAFQNKAVPKGFSGTWKMVTGFGSAEYSNWKNAARKLAIELE